jgi:hypothetical protein
MWFGLLAALAVVFCHCGELLRTVQTVSLEPVLHTSIAEQAFLSQDNEGVSGLRGSPSSSPAGPATFTTGSIQDFMVGVTAIHRQPTSPAIFWPDTFSGTYDSPLFMMSVQHRGLAGAGRLHRLPRREWKHGGQHGHQRDPNRRIDHLHDHRHFGYRLHHPTRKAHQVIHLSNGGAPVNYNVDSDQS